MVVYKATNKLNNHIYIGQTVNRFDKRKIQHLSDAKNNRYPNFYFHRALRKYGKENFKWEILHRNVCDVNTLSVLEQLEIIINDSFKNGYNMTTGGEGFNGYRHSEETKKKIKLNNSKYWKNKKIPEKTREKIRQTLIGRYAGEKNPFFGKTHSDETKKKVSEAGKNRPIETYYQKPVVQLDKDSGAIIKKFLSCAEAQRTLKINNVSVCCNGKQKTAGGFIWIYESEYSKEKVDEKLDMFNLWGKRRKI